MSACTLRATPLPACAAGDGSTRLELHHSDIPVHDRFGNGGQNRSAEGGWKERIFGGIKSIIGFGMEEED